MQIRKLGRTGLKVSAICLGTMTFGNQADEAESFSIMDRAWDGGVFFFDTADAYPVPPLPETVGRTEAILGRWLERNPGRRQDLVLASKCRFPMGKGPNHGGLSRRHVIAACEASLRRLKTDWLDLYQAHAPDPDTPIEETLAAFDDLVRAGKIRYAGCSNFPAWQLAMALGVSAAHGWARLDCHQPRYNLLYRDIEAELLPLCRQQGVGVIAYNPLAGGFLTGKYQKDASPPAGTRFTLGGQTGAIYRERYWQAAYFDAIEPLRAHCLAAGRSLGQLAIAWVLEQPGVTSAIVGASRAAQLEQTLPAAELSLSDEDRAACDAVWYRIPRRPLTTGAVQPERK